MKHLPTELLVEMLSRLPFKDRVIATHVCSVWRTASHEHPAKLWSRFRVSDTETSAQCLWDILERSQHPITGNWVPIDIYVELAYDYGNYALLAIAEHMHHIRSLAIYQSQRYPLSYDAALKIRAAVLLSPAPLLEHLKLDFEFIHELEDVNRNLDSDDEDYWLPSDDWILLDVGDEMVPSDLLEPVPRPWMAIPPEAFAGQAPRLRSLELMGGFVILQDCPALANVRALSMVVGSAGESDPDRCEELVDRTLQSISRLPLLQHLRLGRLDMRLLNAFAQRRPIQHPLDELHIFTFYQQDPTPLLCYFNYEHAGLVRTEMYEGWTTAFETRANSAPTVLEVEQRPRNTSFDPEERIFYDWNLFAANGGVWIVPKPFARPLINIDYLARSLSALSLPIAECVEFSELRFLQLERLVVVLTSNAESSFISRHGMPPLVQERPMPVPENFKMECPALRELHLACCSSDLRLPSVRWTVSVATITNFIDRHLLLSELCFKGIHLCNLRLDVEGGPAGASTLRTRYGAVVVSSQSEPSKALVVSNSFWSSTGPYAWDED